MGIDLINSSELLTISVLSDFFNPYFSQSASYKSFQTEVDSGKLLIGKSERSALPPVSPRLAVHRATSLPRATPGTTITHQNPPLSGSVTDIRQLRTPTPTHEEEPPEPKPFSFGQRYSYYNVNWTCWMFRIHSILCYIALYKELIYKYMFTVVALFTGQRNR